LYKLILNLSPSILHPFIVRDACVRLYIPEAQSRHNNYLPPCAVVPTGFPYHCVLTLRLRSRCLYSTHVNCFRVFACGHRVLYRPKMPYSLACTALYAFYMLCGCVSALQFFAYIVLYAFCMLCGCVSALRNLSYNCQA